MIDPRLQALADRIREAVAASPYSGAEIARLIGVDKSAVSRWISGERTPTMKNLYDLADLLQKEISELWDGPQATPMTPEQKLAIERLQKLPLARQQAYLALLASEADQDQRNPEGV